MEPWQKSLIPVRHFLIQKTPEETTVLSIGTVVVLSNMRQRDLLKVVRVISVQVAGPDGRGEIRVAAIRQDLVTTAQEVGGVPVVVIPEAKLLNVVNNKGRQTMLV